MQHLSFSEKVKVFFQSPFFTRYTYILGIWLATALVLVISRVLHNGLHNNYKIYKYVFWNVLDRLPLYQPRPGVYDDLNHYGPIFSLIIAPFAVLPDVIGGTLWLFSLSIALFFSIRQLPLQRWQHVVIYWIIFNSLISAETNVQFNIAIAACLIYSYVFIKKEKDIWAAFAIMLGAFVKLYGIVGLAFFFFSKHRIKLLLWCVSWGLVFFVLPMLISSPQYILDQYIGWYTELIIKNGNNNVALFQNVSFIGMIKKSTGHLEWSSLPMLIGGLLVFSLPYLRVKEYMEERYGLLLLASCLIFIVLFSTGSEPNTYIIALVGVAIWFVIQPRPYSNWSYFLLIFTLLFSSFASSDLFPRWIYKSYILPNALQALPCTLVWLTITYEMIFKRSADYVIKE